VSWMSGCVGRWRWRRRGGDSNIYNHSNRFLKELKNLACVTGAYIKAGTRVPYLSPFKINHFEVWSPGIVGQKGFRLLQTLIRVIVHTFYIALFATILVLQIKRIQYIISPTFVLPTTRKQNLFRTSLAIFSILHPTDFLIQGRTNSVYTCDKLQSRSEDFKIRMNDLRATMNVSPHHSPEVVTELMEHIRLDWFVIESDKYLLELQEIWSPPNPILLYKTMLELDSIPNPQNRGRRIPYIEIWKEYLFYNKATVFYWTQSASNMVGRKGPVILGGIWNAWTAALGREPHMQLDDFFAVPVQVKEQFAKTVPGILKAYKYICAQIRKAMEENSRAKALIRSGEPWPDPRYSNYIQFAKHL
jgi:hypothetical protein